MIPKERSRSDNPSVAGDMEKAERSFKMISREFDRLEEYVDAIDRTAIEPL